MILDGEIVEAMLFIVLIFEMSHELTIKKKKKIQRCAVWLLMIITGHKNCVPEKSGGDCG